ncbi:hypothetical protein P692DRAFT_201308895 [Suillus brevipes Sb2]|nr:hypothetical protein P692DRAFT_201308895 [Suillus brevipes Sb2]
MNNRCFVPTMSGVLCVWYLSVTGARAWTKPGDSSHNFYSSGARTSRPIIITLKLITRCIMSLITGSHSALQN